MDGLNSAYRIEPATRDDAEFIGKAVCFAERAHTGKGIWDVLCPERVIDVLAKACVDDPQSHFYFSRFFVARHVPTGRAVAAMCGFCYPDCGLERSKNGLCSAMVDIGVVSTMEEAYYCWDRLKFLDESFPADVEYNDTWMVESVYTEPDHRGQGLSYALMQRVFQTGVELGKARMLISCANGNNAAKSLYIKAGFREVSSVTSEECQSALGTSGFTILQRNF